MKFQVNDGEQYQKVMEAEVPAEEMELAIRQAGKSLAAKVNIPGFRKGKAPQHIIENFVGVDAILNEAADELLPRAYMEGLQELGLKPVEQPKIEMVQLKPHEAMIFKATFTVRPEITLGQYQGLKVTKYVSEVTEAEIDADIEAQRQRMARTEVAPEDYAAAEQDTVLIDFEGFKEGVPFDGGKAEKYPLTLGSHNFIPGFEEQLIGVKTGEEREINVVFPENYQEQSLAGQPVLFKVKLHEIKRRLMPELDDDFVQEVSETAENMADLRQEIKARLTERHQESAENEAKDSAVRLAVENTPIDLPPVMVEQRLDSMVNNMAERLRAQGMELTQFLTYTGQTMEQLRQSSRQQADYAERRELLLEEIVKAEQLEASEEEIQQELELMAANYWMPVEQVREALEQNNRLSVIVEDIKLNKAVDLIYAAAEISEEAAPAPEAAAEEAAPETSDVRPEAAPEQ